MKANELRQFRIGNWVYDHENVPREVDYIIADRIGLKNDCGGTQKYQLDPIFSGDINDINPIPLTPEILEKCGFKKIITQKTIEWVHYQNEYCWIYLIKDGYEIEWITGGERFNFLITFKYVHQLQNLYFSLTGEELSVNLA